MIQEKHYWGPERVEEGTKGDKVKGMHHLRERALRGRLNGCENVTKGD